MKYQISAKATITTNAFPLIKGVRGIFFSLHLSIEEFSPTHFALDSALPFPKIATDANPFPAARFRVLHPINTRRHGRAMCHPLRLPNSTSLHVSYDPAGIRCL